MIQSLAFFVCDVDSIFCYNTFVFTTSFLRKLWERGFTQILNGKGEVIYHFQGHYTKKESILKSLEDLLFVKSFFSVRKQNLN